MFEQVTYKCPGCGYSIGEHLPGKETFTCGTCQRRFRVALDEETGRAAFFEEGAVEIPPPLWIPVGSIRALVAVTMAGSSWLTFMFVGGGYATAPQALMLALACVPSFYYGSRS